MVTEGDIKKLVVGILEAGGWIPWSPSPTAFFGKGKKKGKRGKINFRRQDIFKAFDIIATRGNSRTRWIQFFTATNLAARRKKVLTNSPVVDLFHNSVELWSYKHPERPRREPKVFDIYLARRAQEERSWGAFVLSGDILIFEKIYCAEIYQAEPLNFEVYKI